MKIQLKLTFTALLLSTTGAMAQYIGYAPVNQGIDPNATGLYYDALNISQVAPAFGTARVQGMSGVNTALGADISSLGGNPAGLGLMRKGEFSFSMQPSFTAGNTNYLGQNVTKTKGNFNIPNISLAFGNRKEDFVPGAFRGGTFSIGLNRVANYNSLTGYEGVLPTQQLSNGSYTYNSYVDYINNIAYLGGYRTDIPARYNNFSPLSSTEAMINQAYQVYLLDKDYSQGGDTNNFVTYQPIGNRAIKGSTRTSGSRNDISAGYGANFMDKFYIGASLGLQTIAYYEERIYTETATNKAVNPNDGYGVGIPITVKNDYKVGGTGINTRIGVIYKPSQLLRLGLSYTSPTAFYLKQTLNSQINVNYGGSTVLYGTGVNTYASITPGNMTFKNDEMQYNYNMTTPSRISFGVATIGSIGVLSADVDYNQYHNINLSGDDGDNLSGDNNTIRNLYRNALTVKLGGEVKADIYRFRLGGAYAQSPYKNTTNLQNFVNRDVISVSAGAGIRVADYYVDLSVVNTTLTRAGIFHDYMPSVQSKISQTNITLSGGVYF